MDGNLDLDPVEGIMDQDYDNVPHAEDDLRFDDNNFDEQESEDSDFSDYEDDVPDGIRKEAIADYLLFLRGCTRCTNEDVLLTLQVLQKVIEQYVRYYLLALVNDLQRGNVHLRNINIENHVRDIDCSQGLNTIYHQDKYFKKKFNLVTPTRVELGANFKPFGSAPVDGDQPVRRKGDEFIHIPITEVLPRWLENGSYGNVLKLPREAKDGVLQTCLDGSHFKSHPYLQRKPGCKLIKIFYDEVDMCDAAGSKSSSTNKLGMFYWSDEDISPQHSSQLKFINLLGIISNPHVKTYGINSILRYVVDDLKQLENGIVLKNGETLYGCTSCLISDNLAAHQLCGFRESFSATHPCRVCKAAKEVTRTMVREDPRLLRSPAEHDRQVAEIENANEEDKPRLMAEYGINKISVLNELEGFHVVTSAPPDLTHDNLEGICILTTRLFLKQICIEQNAVTLQEINNRIANYDYGDSEKSSKPSPITRAQLLDPSKGLKKNPLKWLSW